MGPEPAAICRPVLFGDPAALDMHMRACGIDIAFDIGVTLNAFDWDTPAPKLCARNQFGSAPFELGAVNAQNGLASLDSASAAITECPSGQSLLKAQKALANELVAVINEIRRHLSLARNDQSPSSAKSHHHRAPSPIILTAIVIENS